MESVIDHHKYRDEIEALLVAGWAPVSVNARLARIHQDYESVNERTMRRHRQDKLAGVGLPLEEWEQRLEEEHALLDPVRILAAEILIQKSRLQQALTQEKEKLLDVGKMDVGVGFEIDRLAHLCVIYQEQCERMGINRPWGPAQGEVLTMEVVLRKEFESLPAPLKERLEALLKEAFDAQVRQRIVEADKERKALMPPAAHNGKQA